MKGYIINLTVSIDNAYALPWKSWAQEEYFPFLNRWPFVRDIVFTRVLSKDDDGYTYSIQIVVANQVGVAYFERDCMLTFVDMVNNQFTGKIVFFKTLLELQ
jgi:hypothetical protein